MIARERLLGLAQHIGGAHTATNQRSWFGSLSIEVAVSSLIGPPSWCTIGWCRGGECVVGLRVVRRLRCVCGSERANE